ncbi:hypothetical protein [Streptomyces sp. CB03238]|uniref:hypothetical protein n=1 Tax=Streptomyces sp. CB03238 TaxID=1907777 RepID=UPI000A11F24E|nr:hypothetical protein [Streptomyces sp. CB03238]ORT56404.1 hypothetical protein BKD26_28415 [Streptomyces sp. CB03238]
MNIRLPFRLLAAAAAAVLALTACSGSDGSRGAPTSPSTGTTTSTPAPGTSIPSTSAPAPSPSSPKPAPSTPPPTMPAPGTSAPLIGVGRLQPLWPFTSLDQARAWQREYRSGGHQPWHLSPEQTALAFTRNYLGFHEIDRITKRTVSALHARIGVGLSGPETTGTAAVVHLVRYGTGPDAPWEVVGTDDTHFSLTRPAYGSFALSPLRTGGRISGVDESIRVQVRQPSSEAPLGSSCCTPGGGTGQPWSLTVSFTGATDPVLTVVATTGGHIAEVERFTVTAVRTR